MGAVKQDTTIAGSGFAIYVQSVRDTIANAAATDSSHTLSFSPGGFVIDLGNGETLTVTVPMQTVATVATGGLAQIDAVNASLLLTAATAVPEPPMWWVMLAGVGILLLARTRGSRG